MNEEMKLELARQIEWMFENYLERKELPKPSVEDQDNLVEDVIKLINLAERIDG